ncbi:DUF6959 family protein [Stenotrophomonas tumulicola]|uniref:Uncharacterized protein n=1 Tax=Stenotrophomonas tumulicola TaxID=1685415 RepID=A0A7W3IGF0_9GAMM|nr:hypothetical protein [Stenotrophomonas tumulicola]MBA8680840.1 hypothetical protein [Stenotrophomonas tumulicola]
MNAQLATKTQTTISLYGRLGNHAVVRMPGRRHPGLIVQADTVSGFVSQLQEAQSSLRAGRLPRADAEMGLLITVLQEWYAQIEERLAEAGEAID